VYINELNHKVHELPSQEVDMSLLNKLAKVDSSYAVLNSRIQSLGRSNKDLQLSLNLLLEASGELSGSKVTNEYITVNEGETFYQSSDGTLELLTTVIEELDSIKHAYKINLGEAHVDIFKGRRKQYDAYLTFTNPNLQLSSQKAFVASKPVPRFVLTAGIGYGAAYANKQLLLAPTIGLHAGIPLYTYYTHK
jgi:hypothetical protein